MRTLVRNFEPVRRTNALPTFFDTFFNEVDRFETPSSVKTSPSVNVLESEENFTVELAAPGLTREDFKVNVHEGVMTIFSEKKEEEEGTHANFTRREFNYLSFKRSFNLPDTIDSEQIAANYTDGILRVTLPKKEEAKPKEPKMIEVA